MKKLFLFLMMAVMLSGVKAQEQVTIGAGTQYNNLMAIPGYFGYHSSAYLYTSDEMPQGGVTISSLSFETQSVSAGSNRALKIWLKERSRVLCLLSLLRLQNIKRYQRKILKRCRG
jgi:hypothetical protein